jgi:hypothetical protein
MDDKLRRIYARHHRRLYDKRYPLRRFHGRMHRNHYKGSKTKWIILILVVVIGLIIGITTMVQRKIEADSRKNIGNLLLTALEPVGSTMYIWGGGWDDAET